jgi:hypothetical protein
MANSGIEVSSSGLKLSYLRFISDSAPGFVVLLLVGFSWQHDPRPSWMQAKEVSVVLAALLFFLATPVGLTINAVSHFVIGHIQTEINRICFLSNHWPLSDSRRSMMVKETTDHFGFTADDWPERNDGYGDLVETYRPDIALRIEHLRGLKRFARSMSFISFLCFVCLKIEWGLAIVVTVVIAHWLLAAARRLSVKYHFGVPRMRELWLVIVLSLLALTGFAMSVGRSCIPLNLALQQISTVALAVAGIILAGMVDFFQRATIAMHLYLETKENFKGIRDVLVESAKRLRS